MSSVWVNVPWILLCAAACCHPMHTSAFQADGSGTSGTEPDISRSGIDSPDTTVDVHSADLDGMRPSKPTKDLTFKGYPHPETKWFFLVQTGMIYMLDAEDEPARMILDVGLMRNLGSRWAVGGNAHLEVGDGEGGFGFLGRGRRWLSRSISVDLATGVLIPDENSGGNGGNTTSWISQAHLNLGNLVSLTAEVDRWTYDYGEDPFSPALETVSGTNWYLGGSIGYIPGLISFVAFGVLLAATW